MESPGEYLKREREHRGVTLKSVHEAVRVPMKYLEALEADDYDSLPHPTFIKGFIKTYCKHLGLDETDAVLRFEMYMRERAEKPEVRRAPLQPVKTPVPSSNPKVIPILVAAAVIVIVVFYLYASRKGAKVEEPSAPGNGAGVAEIKDIGQDSGAPKEIKMAEGLKLEERPLSGYAVGAEGAPEGGRDKEGRMDKAQRDKDAKAIGAPGAVKYGGKHVLTFKATDTVWIKVRIDNGDAFDVVLRKGEKITWKANEIFSVLIGNAGGVEMTFDDETVTLLGKSGEVVNFTLPREAGGAKAKAQ